MVLGCCGLVVRRCGVAGQLQFGFPAGGGTLEVAGTLSITGDLFARAISVRALELIHVLAGGTLNRVRGSGHDDA